MTKTYEVTMYIYDRKPNSKYIIADNVDIAKDGILKFFINCDSKPSGRLIAAFSEWESFREVAYTGKGTLKFSEPNIFTHNHFLEDFDKVMEDFFKSGEKGKTKSKAATKKKEVKPEVGKKCDNKKAADTDIVDILYNGLQAFLKDINTMCDAEKSK